MKLFDTTLARLERSLDVRLVRHNVLAGNVANVDTPGYRPKDVDFATAMATQPGQSADGQGGPAAPSAMVATDGRHMNVAGGIAAEISAAEVPLMDGAGEAPSIDGNAVDLDRTMVALAENNLQYGASARAASKKLAILRYVASDGNG